MVDVISKVNLAKSVAAWRQASGRGRQLTQVTLRPEWGLPEGLWLEQMVVIVYGNVFFPAMDVYTLPVDTPGRN